MKLAAADQEFEAAAGFRNRLRAVRSLLERQRIANESVGTLDAIAVAVEEADANAQVFQVRDGVLADRQSFYLENAGERDEADVRLARRSWSLEVSRIGRRCRSRFIRTSLAASSAMPCPR
jgi:excinuclease UvrABC nuclease subunit